MLSHSTKWGKTKKRLCKGDSASGFKEWLSKKAYINIPHLNTLTLAPFVSLGLSPNLHVWLMKTAVNISLSEEVRVCVDHDLIFRLF